MKHSFFSILFMATALACLPGTYEVFGTEPYPVNHTLSVRKDSAKADAWGSLSCSLPAPSSFDGERTSGATAFLSWSAVGDAAAYRLQVYDESSVLIYNSFEYGTSKSLSGLEPGTSYRCVLASACSIGATSDFIIIADILE
jgi:hypothetical protein